MSYHLVSYSTGGKHKRIPSVYRDNLFSVTSEGGQTDFIVTNGTITSSCKISVLINGIDYYEVVGVNGWQRNVGDNKITTGRTMPKNANIIVRIYDFD